jgi:hypothetical protein
MSTPITTVLGKKIAQARRDHKLSPAILAMLAGLTEAQILGIEEASRSVFVSEAHRIDCARRIALAMGFPRDQFIESSAPIALTPQGRSEIQVARAAWQHLPVAELELLSDLASTDLPASPSERRQGSPLLVALGIALLLAGLMVTLTRLH